MDLPKDISDNLPKVDNYYLSQRFNVGSVKSFLINTSSLTNIVNKTTHLGFVVYKPLYNWYYLIDSYIFKLYDNKYIVYNCKANKLIVIYKENDNYKYNYISFNDYAIMYAYTDYAKHMEYLAEHII